MWKLSRDITLAERDKLNDCVDRQDYLGLLTLRQKLGIDLIPDKVNICQLCLWHCIEGGI